MLNQKFNYIFSNFNHAVHISEHAILTYPNGIPSTAAAVCCHGGCHGDHRG